MGPRSRERGKKIRQHRQFKGQIASMGPRSRERGKITSRARHLRRSRASMGPRSRERGKAMDKILDKAEVKLQWGRAHVSAESGGFGFQFAGLFQLQWGRAHVSAESASGETLSKSN